MQKTPYVPNTIENILSTNDVKMLNKIKSEMYDHERRFKKPGEPRSYQQVSVSEDKNIVISVAAGAGKTGTRISERQQLGRLERSGGNTEKDFRPETSNQEH